jgi:hypothetical protein
MAEPRTCAATWHAPGSSWEYPCNVLGLEAAARAVDGFPFDGRIHRYADIHTHIRDGLTIEWVDPAVTPQRTGGAHA